MKIKPDAPKQRYVFEKVDHNKRDVYDTEPRRRLGSVSFYGGRNGYTAFDLEGTLLKTGIKNGRDAKRAVVSASR